MRLRTQLKTEKKQRNPLGPWNKREADVEISLLTNSIYYFLQCVFIIKEGEEFRLVVIHNNRVRTDKQFDSLRGARIAFTKLYDELAWEENVKAQWSHFYPPDAKWLEDKVKPSVRIRQK